jgi:hypothetical protein
MVGLNALDRFAWIGAFSSGGLSTNYPALFPGLEPEANRQLRLLWLGCGEQDGLLAANQNLYQWLTSRGVRHSWVQTPGQHSFRVWRREPLRDPSGMLPQRQRQLSRHHQRPAGAGLHQFLRLFITGEPGRRRTIEASTNLTTWRTLAEQTNAPEELDFTDTDSSLYTVRFYRVVVNAPGLSRGEVVGTRILPPPSIP